MSSKEETKQDAGVEGGDVKPEKEEKKENETSPSGLDRDEGAEGGEDKPDKEEKEGDTAPSSGFDTEKTEKTWKVRKGVLVLDDQEEEKPKPKETDITTSDFLKSYFAKALGISNEPPPEKVLEEVTFEGVAKYLNSDRCNNIITMAGAGISTSAGIPDFRSPGSGLYDNLEKYNLPSPQAIFDIDYFKSNPEPFFTLAKELWPGTFKPTPCHYFLKLLENKGKLLRHYTQNIDTLERVAEIGDDKIVEAHGTFHRSHCVQCGKEFSQDWIKEKIFADEVPRCEEEDCEGLVKPDIVFFGEALPPRFFMCAQNDFQKCDLLIIMGTSLVVQPFASLTSRVTDVCPRLYINLEKTGGGGGHPLTMLMFGGGFAFDTEDNYRDVFHQATCDDGCQQLADLLGWGEELKNLVKTKHAEIDKQEKQGKKTTAPGKTGAKSSTTTASPKAAATTPNKPTQQKDSPSSTPSKSGETNTKSASKDNGKPQSASGNTKNNVSDKSSPKKSQSSGAENSTTDPVSKDSNPASKPASARKATKETSSPKKKPNSKV